MGFRLRKSFGGKAFRVNISKSGIGYSTGVKGFRVTKKAGGGTRTTSSIPGTGISFVNDYGSGSNSAPVRRSKPSTDSYEKVGQNNKKNTERLEHSTWQLIKITLLVYFLFLYFVPLVFAIIEIHKFCKEANQFKHDHWTDECKQHTFKIFQSDNTKTSLNIVLMVFLSCLWFLVFPLFIVNKMLKDFNDEYNFIQKAYNDYAESIRKAREIEKNNIIDVLLADDIKIIEQSDNNIKGSVMRKDDYAALDLDTLQKLAAERAENYLRIIKDSAYIAESTTNVETFFSRYNLLLNSYKALIPFEDFLSFGDNKPSQAYQQILESREETIEEFISKYIAFVVADASELKTERGKNARYKKAHENLTLYYAEMSNDNIAYVEAEFATLIN